MTSPARRRALWGAVALALLGATGAAAWRTPRWRHEVRYWQTKRDAARDGSPRAPAAGAPADADAIVVMLHAGKPGPGYLANSERSLRAAAERARAVEIDVTLTTDLVPYLTHDDDLGRNAGSGPDRASAHTAAELDAITFTDGTRPMRLSTFARELLPRFDRVVIDLKTRRDGAAAKARALLEALGPAPRDRLQFIGRPGPVLMELARLEPGLALGCETYGPAANRAEGFTVYSMRATEVTQDADRRAREAGLHRLYWTAQSAEQLARLQAWRPEAIIVDLADAGADALPAAWRRGAAPPREELPAAGAPGEPLAP